MERGEGEIPSNLGGETQELHYGTDNEGIALSWQERGEELREIL